MNVTTTFRFANCTDAFSLEWLSGEHALLRHHPVGGYGDGYDLVCTVVLDDATPVASLKGMMCQSAYSRRLRLGIVRVMRSIGVECVAFDRRCGVPRSFALMR